MVRQSFVGADPARPRADQIFAPPALLPQPSPECCGAEGCEVWLRIKMAPIEGECGSSLVTGRGDAGGVLLPHASSVVGAT